MSVRLAARARRIKPSPTLGMAAEAAAMKAAGQDIVDLSAGEPDFATPAHVCEAARQAMERGETKYTPVGGTTALKDAIREKLRRDDGLEYSRNEIVASCGGKHALYNAFQVLLEEGDEVVVPAPYWVSYYDMLLLAGATPRVVHTLPEDGFALRPDRLEAACGPKTVGVILNSPSNPTGAVYDAETLRALGEVALRRGLVVFSDDIYEHIVETRVPNIVTMVPALRPQTVLLNAVSKTYAMTGWRIGWAAGPAEAIAAMTALQSQSTSNPTSIAQAAAVAALTGPQDCVAAMAREFLARRDLVMTCLATIPRLETVRPGGAFYVFPDVSAYFGRQGPDGPIATAQDLATYLLRHAGVATVPGESFGAPRHLRLSYATAPALIEEGIRRIARALAALA